LAESRPAHFTTELEGLRAPLGVILYLIRRDNLDVYDIPIARITREYLDYLNAMEEMQIELAVRYVRSRARRLGRFCPSSVV
jgi:chromatin segregation and condensation protein Rec8/ScpA/Scc1 (kleisin family)